MSRRLGAIVAVMAAVLIPAASALGEATEPRVYVVHPDESTLRIHVGTAGLFGFLGHDHLIEARGFEGRVTWNASAPERSTVELRFDSRSLVVVDPEASDEKRGKIQADMEAKVLEVDSFPEIRFEAAVFRHQKDGATLSGTVRGSLTLHGASKSLDVPVAVTLDPDELRAKGEVTFKGSRFGVKQAKAGAGTVKTKDALRIEFDIVARSETGP